MTDPRGIKAPNLITETPLFIDESEVPEILDDANREPPKTTYASLPLTYESVLENLWHSHKDKKR